jgi:hypothetical protein
VAHFLQLVAVLVVAVTALPHSLVVRVVEPHNQLAQVQVTQAVTVLLRVMRVARLAASVLAVAVVQVKLVTTAFHLAAKKAVMVAMALRRLLLAHL